VVIGSTTKSDGMWYLHVPILAGVVSFSIPAYTRLQHYISLNFAKRVCASPRLSAICASSISAIIPRLLAHLSTSMT